MQAANAAALTRPECVSVQPFYWEIGDGNGPLGGGGAPTSQTAYDRDTSMLIASASKWWFGAYLAELRNGQLDEPDLRAARMQSGYHRFSYTACLRTLPAEQAAVTVSECQQAAGNDTFTPADVGRFHYDSAHFQKHASIDLGLGENNNVQLADSVGAMLGMDVDFVYNSPQLAAGGVSSVSRYALFLQKLIRHDLKLGSMLGSQAVCTHVGGDCPTSNFTPIPGREAWHYSIGHWVEDDPNLGDGAFSSPGAFGFYPWIGADREQYGILARYDVRATAYVASYSCGRLIRRAFETAAAP